MNINKAIESLMGKLPDMNQLMPGYELKDGKLKAVVEYSTTNNEEVVDESGVIMLYANDSILIPSNIPTMLLTQLTLNIKPKEMAFVYFLTAPALTSLGANILLPNKKENIFFWATSTTGGTVNIAKGTRIGYGYFQPIIPMNNIALTLQDATP